MITDSFISRVSSYAALNGVSIDPYDTGVADLSLASSRKTTDSRACLYQPTFCLILQGRKEVHVGATRHVFTPGDAVIVTHDVPMVSRITEASVEAPYIALSLPIALHTMRSLYSEIDEAALEQEKGESFKVGKAEPALIDAVSRLFALVKQPREARLIAPLIVKEIYFRLLLAPHGAMLRHLLQRGSAAGRVSKVIADIKQHYATSFTVDELAATAMMSPSSFYENFKSITATTPLQFQKDIRLLEARRLLMDTRQTVSAVAFEVGYQSPAQFSRDYSRKFGQSPRVDKKKLSFT